jgi:hypothetical protein
MNGYHESETIILRGRRCWPRNELHAFLVELGFKAEDDFYHIQRKGKLPVWQSSTMLSLDVQLNGGAIYATEEDVAEGTAGNWDTLVGKYLMATVPAECIAPVVQIIFRICERFDLQAMYHGRQHSESELIQALTTVADELTASLDKPGSETLAILIEQSYSK